MKRTTGFQINSDYSLNDTAGTALYVSPLIVKIETMKFQDLKKNRIRVAGKA